MQITLYENPYSLVQTEEALNRGLKVSLSVKPNIIRDFPVVIDTEKYILEESSDQNYIRIQRRIR